MCILPEAFEHVFVCVLLWLYRMLCFVKRNELWSFIAHMCLRKLLLVIVIEWQLTVVRLGAWL